MRSIYSAAALIAAIGISGAASAQRSEDLYPSGVTIRAGVAVPLDATLSNIANALGNVGLEYTLPNSLMSVGETYFSVDLFFKAFQGNGNGRVVPVMINQRFYGSNMERRSYYFAGIGAAFTDVNGSGTALAVRGGIGQEIGKSTIAELAVYLSDKAGGVRANAVTLNFGYRF